MAAKPKIYKWQKSIGSKRTDSKPKALEPKEVDGFLKELTALANKYQIGIGACSCCQSPWLYRLLSVGSYDVDGAYEHLGYREHTKPFSPKKS